MCKKSYHKFSVTDSEIRIKIIYSCIKEMLQKVSGSNLSFYSSHMPVFNIQDQFILDICLVFCCVISDIMIQIHFVE